MFPRHFAQRGRVGASLASRWRMRELQCVKIRWNTDHYEFSADVPLPLWEREAGLDLGCCWFMHLFLSRSPAKHARRQEQDRLQEREQGGKGDAHQPERQGEQPDEGPEHQDQQGQWPAQDEEEAPGHYRDENLQLKAP